MIRTRGLLLLSALLLSLLPTWAKNPSQLWYPLDKFPDMGKILLVGFNYNSTSSQHGVYLRGSAGEYSRLDANNQYTVANDGSVYSLTAPGGEEFSALYDDARLPLTGWNHEVAETELLVLQPIAAAYGATEVVQVHFKSCNVPASHSVEFKLHQQGSNLGTLDSVADAQLDGYMIYSFSPVEAGVDVGDDYSIEVISVETGFSTFSATFSIVDSDITSVTAPYIMGAYDAGASFGYYDYDSVDTFQYPFNAYWLGTTHQSFYPASELYAMGLQPGDTLTEVTFFLAKAFPVNVAYTEFRIGHK